MIDWISDKIKKTKQEIFKNNYKTDFELIIKYMLVILIIEAVGFMELYDQSFPRRIINMYRRRDYLSYMKKLDPFCERVQYMLNENDVKRLQSINIPEKKDIPWLSRKNTTSHQCCEGWSTSEQEIILDISEKIRQQYEKQVDTKLYHMKDSKPTIYVYRGNKSQHLWHVDPRNLKTIYNVIICIKKVGNISPLQCKDKNGNAYSVDFEPGHAAIFNGGTTIHQVPPNDDPTSTTPYSV